MGEVLSKEEIAHDLLVQGYIETRVISSGISVKLSDRGVITYRLLENILNGKGGDKP